MSLLVYWLLSVLCKKTHYLSKLSKPQVLLQKNTQQGPSGTKVPRLGMCRSIISLSKIILQMQCDRPFSQKNKTTKRAVGWRLEATGKGQRWTKFENGVGVGNIGVFPLKRGVRNPLSIMAYIKKMKNYKTYHSI